MNLKSVHKISFIFLERLTQITNSCECRVQRSRKAIAFSHSKDIRHGTGIQYNYDSYWSVTKGTIENTNLNYISK
jgi:hypothetical protein